MSKPKTRTELNQLFNVVFYDPGNGEVAWDVNLAGRVILGSDGSCVDYATAASEAEAAIRAFATEHGAV